MASLASYIIWKTHCLNLQAAAKEMQRNVAAVAVVFCISYLPATIYWGELALSSKGKSSLPYVPEISNFFLAVNSAVNVFIYLAVGKSFRKKVLQLICQCGQRF
jgi:hypothetical protein